VHAPMEIHFLYTYTKYLKSSSTKEVLLLLLPKK